MLSILPAIAIVFMLRCQPPPSPANFMQAASSHYSNRLYHPACFTYHLHYWSLSPGPVLIHKQATGYKTLPGFTAVACKLRQYIDSTCEHEKLHTAIQNAL
jgi:hypothetical protein